MLEIAIIGAGPAGLATALQLHQKGFRPSIYESVSEIRPLGVGLDIKPYATREIVEIGLFDEFCSISVEARESIFLNGWGQQIFAEKCGLHMGYSNEQRFVHRGSFQMMLYDAVRRRIGPDAVQLGARCIGIDQDERGVTVRFEPQRPDAPTEIRADIVIGVDGIKSAVRNQLLPQSVGTHYSGITLWRGVTVMKPWKSGGSILHIGDPVRQGSLIVYPIQNNTDGKGNQLINWVIEQNGRPEIVEDWNHLVTPNEVPNLFEECRLDFIDLGEMVHSAREVYIFPLVDHDPLPHWSFGRITLLGDAAHAMYPRGGNGVCQALVDARVIAEKLASIPDPIEALREYEAERREAVNWIVHANRSDGPEIVRRIAEERSGGKPFAGINSIMPNAEIESIFMEYHRKAGMRRPDDESGKPCAFPSVFTASH